MMRFLALIVNFLAVTIAYQLSRPVPPNVKFASSLGDSTIHITMLSDRVEGVAAAIESICRNAKEPNRLMFYIIGPKENVRDHHEDRWSLKALAPACAQGGASIRTYSMDKMTARVKGAGFQPAWLQEFAEGQSEYTIRPALWDNSTTHNDPFNLLRFYLPHVIPFKRLDKVIFMDDDVIIQDDIAKAWDFQLADDAIMSASCQNWVWSECDRFESSTSLSHLDVPYLGFGRLGMLRNASDAVCENEFQRECIPNGFFELLAEESRKINGERHAVTIQSLGRAVAWNYGFNKFDLNAMRKHQITEKYDKWIALNHKYKLFPTTSLSYGLGLPMLVKLGRVQCFDDVTPVVQGLGFVGPRDMRGAGHYAKQLRSSFGLHFNGPRKPWQVDGANPYSYMFLKYAHTTQKNEVAINFRQHNEKRRLRAETNRTSFILLTDPRSGSEWFMEMLDQHPEICASGEADDGVEGFPREALIPARYGHMNLVNEQLRKLEAAAQADSQRRQVSLLDIDSARSITHRAPRNYYAPTADNVYRVAANLSLRETLLSKVGGFSSCQRKASCSWGFLAGLVWQVANQPELCTGNGPDWEARSEQIGFGQHLKMVCQLRRNARYNLRVVNNSHKPTPVEMQQEVFNIFFRHQMRESLSLNDARYGSILEHKQILPCRCPRSALITGQKMMHDWIGDLPSGGNAAADWKALPADVNYNALNASKTLGTPYYDLIGSMQEIGTVAIVFERENLLARFVSLEAASKSQIFHCDDPRCVEAAARQRVNVNVGDLRKFISWNRKLHARNRALLAEAGIPTLAIDYETCRSDTKTCVEQVTAFLGVAEPSDDLAATAKSIKLVNSLADRIENVDEVAQALQADGDEGWLSS